MITRTHVTLQETVGEFVVSLHIPVGMSFDTVHKIIKNMGDTVEGFAKNAAEQAAAQPDVSQPDQIENVTQA